MTSRKKPESFDPMQMMEETAQAAAVLAGMKAQLVEQGFPNDVAAQLVLEMLRQSGRR